MEFFIEGTRSRINKMLNPKFGLLQILTNSVFDGRVEEVTFVPMTLNYTRVLEGESFPAELTGATKVKESLSRIVKAVEIFAINFGTIYIDIYDPIKLTDALAESKLKHPSLDPFKKKEDRLKFNNELGNKITFVLQQHIRIMPTTLVAACILLYRKGISEAQLAKKITWLGLILQQRNAIVTSDGGLPTATTLKAGLKHLDDYIMKKRNMYMPRVEPNSHDFSNYIMLWYYRNPLNFVFFNESLIVCSIYSFKNEQIWNTGVDVNALYEKVTFLANLLKREEVLKQTFSDDEAGKHYFEHVLKFMQDQRLLEV